MISAEILTERTRDMSPSTKNYEEKDRGKDSRSAIQRPNYSGKTRCSVGYIAYGCRCRVRGGRAAMRRRLRPWPECGQTIRPHHRDGRVPTARPGRSRQPRRGRQLPSFVRLRPPLLHREPVLLQLRKKLSVISLFVSYIICLKKTIFYVRVAVKLWMTTIRARTPTLGRDDEVWNIITNYTKIVNVYDPEFTIIFTISHKYLH